MRPSPIALPDLTEQALALCTPIVRAGQSGLKDSSWIKAETVRTSLNGLLGEPAVGHVTFCSQAAFTGDSGMSEVHSYVRTLSEELDRKFSFRLRTALNTQGIGIYEELKRRFGCDEVVDLVDYLRGSTWHLPRQTVRKLLLLFLTAALTGSADIFRRFTPTVSLLPYCVPIGARRPDTGTWIVLVR
ncbi:hypothetical protein AMJ57_04215 [Parcubacteria bacterium SG8_24]|nr:MAG: hypothetical protein AMJ57_04215 [Parcubacteria bacterium SG8_24]